MMNRLRLIGLMSSALILLGCAMQSKAFDSDNAAKYFHDGQVLQLAIAAADGNVARVKELHSQGVNVNASGEDGITPLLWALTRGSKAGVEELLKLGANPNYQTVSGYSMVSLSVQMKGPEFLMLALDHGGDPNLKIDKGPWHRPIMQAIGPGRLPIIEQLIKAGADVNYQAPVDGETPLTQAAGLNQYDIVYYLLTHGADYKTKNKFGNTVVFFIEHNNIDPNNKLFAWRQKVIELLRSKGVEINPRIP